MDFTNLKNYMDRLVAEYKVPGVDCTVYRNHKRLFRYYTGKSDIENNTDMNGNELYIIFSMTKMITCACAMQLYEQGKFLLSDPVSKFLPEFEKMQISSKACDNSNDAKIIMGVGVDEYQKREFDGYAKNPITMRHLFTMSAGLDYNLDAEYIKKAIASGKTSTLEIVKSMSRCVLEFEPGTHFRYSLCHDVLGAVTEVISGMKLGDYMNEYIFKPLGMKDTFFGIPKDEKRLLRMAKRYTYDETRCPRLLPLECVYNLTEDYQSGGAGLTSSVEDYALFLDAMACGGVGLTGNRILSSAAIDIMRTNQLNETQRLDFENLLPGYEGYGYGLGVRTLTDRGKSGFLCPTGEFGWNGAAGAFALADPTNKLSLTYFQQIHNSDVRIQEELRNVLYSCID